MDSKVPEMTVKMKIDFVSDVSCPWCVIGLKSLETALAKLAGDVQGDIHFQTFELNPQKGPAGQDVVEHIAQKHGSGRSDIEGSLNTLHAHRADLRLAFDMHKRAL